MRKFPAGFSVDEHNAESTAVWKAFWDGKPLRPPVHLEYPIPNELPHTGWPFFIYNKDTLRHTRLAQQD